MSSSWIDSWGNSWGDSWGQITEVLGAIRGVSHGHSSVSGAIEAKAWLHGNVDCLSSAYGLISLIENETEISAGGGHPSISAFILPTGKSRKHRIDDFVTKAMSELYQEITIPKIKKQAAKIVRPFIVDGVKPITIPSVSVIDWEKMEKDSERVSALLKLWQEQVADLEDEEMLLMLMAT